MQWHTHIYATVKIALLAAIASTAVGALGLYRTVVIAESRAAAVVVEAQQAQVELLEDIDTRLKGKTQTSEDIFVDPEHLHKL